MGRNSVIVSVFITNRHIVWELGDLPREALVIPCLVEMWNCGWQRKAAKARQAEE